MDKKYEILYDLNCTSYGRKVYRIRSLRNFSNVKVGDVGGFVASEENLSQDGNCWVYDDAIVHDHALIRGDAAICDHSRIYDYSIIRDRATVCGYAIIRGHTSIYDLAIVRSYDSGYPFFIHGCAVIRGSVIVEKSSEILSIGPLGSRNAYTTFVKQNNEIFVTCGCFYGDIDKFEERVLKTYEANNLYRSDYLNTIRFAKQKFGILNDSIKTE